MKKVEKIFNSLEGMWEINRTFNLVGADFESIHGNGFAIFKKNDVLADSMLYFEKVNIVMPNGRIIEYYQTYLYKLKNSIISKYQINKKADLTVEGMHEYTKMFDFNFRYATNKWPINAEGTFKCSQDTYYANFCFNKSLLLSINYLVEGPNKNYQIYTTYNKSNCTNDLENRMIVIKF